MSSQGVLLRAHQGESGSFIAWLEKLGLKDFLRHYPLSQLEEWGWIVPQARVVFQKGFFLAWENFPCYGDFERAEFETQSLLWDSFWFVDGKEPLWFLDPFFHPGDEAGKLLFDEKWKSCSSQLPDEFTHQNGLTIRPYADYFYHWQGYALIDVIRAADCIQPVLNTPDLPRRVKNLAHIAERVKEWNPESILILANRWGGLAQPMTWLSHYSALREALSHHDSRLELQRVGARELASHLGVTADMLSLAIKEKFLVLAQDWIDANDRLSAWTLRAYSHLQRDISMAVEWLCYLTDKTFNDYLETWRYEGFLGRRKWAELHKVLEFEFFEDRKYFLRMVPEYLKTHDAIFQDGEQLRGERFNAVVCRLHANNYMFGSFLGAFRQLHEELSYRVDRNGALDFRELRPLDHYSLLAIRAEGCLRFAMGQDGVLDDRSKLSEYVAFLARKKGASERVIDCYQRNLKITHLHKAPPDPIGRVMALETDLSQREHLLVQSFLCCELARNYFAHHHYLDDGLIRSRPSGFMLSGILITVLYLLGGD